MWQRILNEMREKVRRREYVLTVHAEEEMANDALTIYDVERGILTGRIVKRQRDRVIAAWKYVIRGQTAAGEGIEIVARLGATGKAVIITVYRLDSDGALQ